PTEFERVSLGDLGITIEYPVNWAAPKPFASLEYVSLHALPNLDNDVYPWFRVARGAPEQHLDNNFTRDISSPQSAVESTVGVVPSGSRQMEGMVYPTYMVNGPTSSHNNWAWVIAVAPDDWVYITLYAPYISDFDTAFAEDVLPRMIRSLQVDGQPIAASAINTTRLNTPPMRVDGPVRDRFNDNVNDWQFVDITDGELILSAQNPEVVTWTFSQTYFDGAPAFYGEVSGRLISDTDRYDIGLVFRVLDGSNYYYYAVTYDQEVWIFKVQDGEWSALVLLATNPNVNVGRDQVNTLGVLVLGDYLEFYLNGELVGVAVDRLLQTGGVRMASYTYEDSSNLTVVAFDNFAYLPLAVAGQPSLTEAGVLPLGTVANLSGAVIRAGTAETSEQLATLDVDQVVVALARTEDNTQLFVYTQGVAGWLPASAVTLTLADEPFSVYGLPLLPAGFDGQVIDLWPVTWPETDQPQPVNAARIAYGQTLGNVVPDDGTVTWAFKGAAGDVIALGTVSDVSSLDLYLRLFGPDGTLVIEDDDSGPGLNPLVEGYTLPATGVYTVEIACLGPGGAFRLALAKN
ncbi:MAG: hypothetical protein JXA10_17260, partial [Anaerolineae bacterium]|nr:hypothetical protein [Anaerolineae bacterium]